MNYAIWSDGMQSLFKSDLVSNIPLEERDGIPVGGNIFQAPHLQVVIDRHAATIGEKPAH